MESVDQASSVSIDHVLLRDLNSSQEDQPLRTTTTKKTNQQFVPPQTAAPNVGQENEFNIASALSVRAIRKSMLPQPERSPQSTQYEGSSSQKSRKRKKSLFNFLSVKEPSSQALHEYEEMLRKQQNNANGRVTAVGMPMTAASKLPAHVPKVNSRWDGVPESIRRKERNKKDIKPKSAGSASWQPSSQTSQNSLQSLENRFDMKSSMKRPTSQGTKSISEMTEVYSIRSNHPTLVRSSASTISSTSTPSLPYSNYDFAVNRHYTSEPTSPQFPAPSPLKSSFTVVNLSSSRNSPDSTADDLQFSTKFPFPENTKDLPAPNVLRPNLAGGMGSSQPHHGNPRPELPEEQASEPESSRANRGIFSKLKQKKSLTFTKLKEKG